jgi:hypothetical protein
MSIIVHPANLENDQRLIIDFLAQHHTSDSDQKRFDWLYRCGPAGEALAWIATDSETGTPIGIAAAFPRRICMEGKDEQAWVLGDFCIARGYRTLGPAVQLQRACLAGLNSEGDAIFYDFPSQPMTAIYQRLGLSQNSRMVRLAKPIRLDKKLRNVIGQPQLARILASVANTGLTLHSGRSQLPPGLTISLQQKACGNDFSQLAERVGSTFGTCIHRSADYLNWRYLQHPFRKHEILTLHRWDSLVGYAVVNPEGHQLNLVDLFGEQDTIPVLVQAVVSLARRRKLDTVTVGILAHHPWAAMIRNLGFLQREKCPVLIGRNGLASTLPCDGWFLINGDRES